MTGASKVGKRLRVGRQAFSCAQKSCSRALFTGLRFLTPLKAPVPVSQPGGGCCMYHPTFLRVPSVVHKLLVKVKDDLQNLEREAEFNSGDRELYIILEK